ncbi:MAG TPA: ABC transporter permease [Chitinophagaceae bacterium]|nr:ABC transporter permease [Chitinophagaceae bacterium]
MIKNHLKQIWRSLIKNKAYSVINIVGLSAGLTCFALIALWINDEVSYDKFNHNFDRIVRLTGMEKRETGISESAVSSAPMARALKDDYAEIENTVRFDLHEEIVEHKGQQILEPGILLTDPSFFDIFSYSLIKGDVRTALNKPYSVILTRSTAKKYFGDADPMGQILIIYMCDSTGRGAPYTITGIMSDPPGNAHFTFNMLASFKTVEVANPDVLTIDGWGDASFYTYLLLKKGVDVKTFSNKISQFYATHIGDRLNIWRSIYFYKLQPLRDIHLRSHLQYELAPTGNISQVYIFATIAIFILLLAGINYTNLATARSAGRAKEVGIKKVVGADKKQLIVHYLSESVFTAILALIFSLFLSVLLQPFFYQLTGKNLSLFSSPVLVIFLTGVTIFLGIVSGIYPAVILSGFKPIGILKGAFKSGGRGILLRKTLVVSQFVITLVLVTSIIIIYSQMSYIKHKDLGYNKDALLFLRVHGNTDVIEGYSAFKNEILANSLISGATISNSLLGSLGSGGSETVDINGNPLQVNTSRLRVDADYLDVYGIKLLAGNNFNIHASADSIRPVILNEVAVKQFGWKDATTAIGKPFKMGNQQGRVIGVVNDFHFSPLQNQIGPLAVYPSGERFSRITLKVNVSKLSQTKAWLEQTWKKNFPSALLDYDFSDNQIQGQYQAEEKFSKIFLYFSVLSLLIACLGLYGLISYTTSQKTKEIGIRKVLGATVNGIVTLLSGNFLKLVLIACFIAMPAAWYVMHKWLQDFAYRTNISWWMFAAAGSLVFLISLITVSIETIKAAIANPVKSLRTE